MVLQAPQGFDSGLGNSGRAPHFAQVPGPTRLPVEVSTYSHRLKRRNLWEKNGRKLPVSRYRFPFMGSKNRPRSLANARYRPAKSIGGRKHRSLRFRSQQFEIIRYSWRRNFYTQASLSAKKVLRSSARVSGQTQPVGCAQRKSARLASPRPGHPTFYLWLHQPKINAVPPVHNERPWNGFPEIK